MSRAAHSSLSFGTQRGSHTGIDDLESFMWLVIWLLLTCGSSSSDLHLLSEEEVIFKYRMQSASDEEVKSVKLEIFGRLRDPKKSFSPLRFLTLFDSTLQFWVQTLIAAENSIDNARFLAQKAAKAAGAYEIPPEATEKLHDEIEKIVLDAFKSCIKKILADVKKMPDSWKGFEKRLKSLWDL